MSVKLTEVAIADIVLRKELMPRKGISDAVVMDYKASLEFLPPILLGVDKDEDGKELLVLLDGWHRLKASEEENHKTIKAVVDKTIHPDNFRAAAARANKAHGRRLTADEKRTVARKLYLEENRDTDFIADVIGCSDRHARRLVESFEKAKRELYMMKAYKMSKKKNPETGKKFTVREVADSLDTPEFQVSKSAVGRWIKKMAKQTADAQIPEPEVIEIDYDAVASDDDADEEPEVVLPTKDLQKADEFIKSASEMTSAVQSIHKKASKLTYSKTTLDRIETVVTILKKEIENLENTLLDLSLA
jgi:ParB-like chromosome segregation protein Spo0J